MKRLAAFLVGLCIPFLAALPALLLSIDLANYPQQSDAGVLTPAEQAIFVDILEAIDAGQIVVECSGEFDRHKLLTHLGMHYGTLEDIADLFVLVNGNVHLNLSTARRLEENRIVIDARIDEAVRNLKEGPDRFKLWQIARYLSGRIEYTDGKSEAIDGLNGAGTCGVYAILFYKMASRLGIPCHICFSYTASGGYHAWNMVELDGTQYFYDITWYDSDGALPNCRYLHSAASWGRSYSVNDLWAAYLEHKGG